jgi:uncharacterized protein (DUF58 family)
MAVLGALMLAPVLAPDTENSVAYQGFSLLFTLLLMSVCFSWSFRPKFSARRLVARFATVGRPLAYTVCVRNLSAKTQTDLSMLEELADPRPAFPEWLAVQLANERRARSFRFVGRRRSNPFRRVKTKAAAMPAAAPGQEVTVKMELTPLRRGLVRIKGLALARPDPLGLFRAFGKLPLPQNVLVLPKRYPVPPIGLPGTMKYQEGGVALASSVGQSDEFVALRDYRHGDPLRHIHWRSWARAGKPVVKEFEDEFFVRHALVLDTFTDEPHSEVFEEAVSVAASFACTLRTQESLLDLLFVGPESYCFTAGRGLAHADQMLEILASVQTCAERPFSALEQLVLEHVAAVSGCLCVLLAWDEARQELVRKLLALGVPVLVLVVVEAGRARTFSPGPMREEPERFHVLEVGQVEQGLTRLS